MLMSCNTLCSTSFLSEPVEDPRDAKVGGGAAPDGADGGHRSHDLDRLGAVGDVPDGWEDKSCDLNLHYLGICDMMSYPATLSPLVTPWARSARAMKATRRRSCPKVFDLSPIS